MSFLEKMREKWEDAPKGLIFLLIAIFSLVFSRVQLEIAARSSRIIDWIFGIVLVVIAFISIMLFGIYNKLEKL